MITVAERYLEREVKLDVDDTFAMPELSEFVPAAGTVDTVVLHLDSTYYDTARRDLLRAKVTLRRRDGGLDDTGWQLKLPTGDARTEVRLPPGTDSAVPRELRELTGGLRRGRALRQLARIRVERTAYRVCDASGRLLVEVADDRVRTTTFGAPAGTGTHTWREAEVELGVGETSLATAIVQHLRDAGARPSTSSSKLARAMGDHPAEERAPLVRARTGRSRTVGELAIAYLHEQRQVLLDGDRELRDGSDAVHHIRVAARRFRSTLRTFGSVFDPQPAMFLDTELAWYAAVLGVVRDAEILRAHLLAVIAGLPDEVVLGEVACTIDQYLLEEQVQGRRAVAKAINSRRYVALLDAVDAFLDDPPFTGKAHAPASRGVKLAERAQKTLGKRLRTVASGAGEPAQVHRARKAAKRARYAVELATPVLRAKVAKRRITALKGLQDTLGDFQDSVVATDALLRMAKRAGTTPKENAFTYGLLYALEQQRAETSRRHVVDALS